jgi:hypothetical protein
MATNQSTIDKITDWADEKYGTTSTPTGIASPQGMLAAASSPTSQTSQAPTIGATATQSTNDYSSQINDLYKNMLRRDVDDASLKWYQGTIDNQGATIGDVRNSILNSDEYRRQNINDLYKTTLGRDGDEAGVNWFLDKMVAGEIDAEGITKALRDSEEYKQRYQPVSNPLQLAQRAVDPATQTVSGQLQRLLAEDSPVLQQARNDAMRTAANRGLLNSSLAASGGTDALIRSATGIATTDSGYYNKAADYNTTAANELAMYDRDQQNQYRRNQMDMDLQQAARDQQLTIAKMQDDTQRQQYANQMSIAKMQDETNRYQAEVSAANSRYNTDSNYQQNVENNKRALVSSIIGNMELSPDRKAALLEQLGEGTMQRNGVPGTGLAGAIYLLDSLAQDLLTADPIYGPVPPVVEDNAMNGG